MVNLSHSLPVDQPILPVNSVVESWGEMYVREDRNSPDGQIDITDQVISCNVTLNTDNDVPWTMNATLDGPNGIKAYQQLLAPYWCTWWLNAAGEQTIVRRQLGLFAFVPPRRDFSRNQQTTTIDGRDMIWQLSQQIASKRMVFGFGIDCGSVAQTILNNSPTGLDIRIPKTGVKTGKIRTIRPGDNLLAAANEVLQAAGYFKLYATSTGVVTTERAYEVAQAEPHRAIYDWRNDLYDSIAIEPDSTAFANRILLKSSNPDADNATKIGFIVDSADQDDPWSVPSIGPFPKLIVDSNDTISDTAKVRARQMLQQKTGIPTRVTLSVVPDPRVEPNEAWWLDIKTDDAASVIQPANWRLISTTFSWGSDANSPATQTATLAKTARLVNVGQG